MNKSVRILLILVMVALLGVFLYSGYQLTRTMHQYNEADRYYSTQAKQFASFTQLPENAPSADPAETGAPLETLREISPRVIDFEALLAASEDVRAWLYSPDTVIDYPVVQAEDNDYYLHRFLDGKYNSSGTLFADFRCPGDFSARHTVIYGHHMNNGTMLGSLEGYRKQEYYDAHPVMYLNTPGGNYRMDLFAAFVTWYDSRVYTFQFIDDQEFEDWYTLMRSYSDFVSEVQLSPGDRIVTLSTCTYDYDNARYVVLAKLVPIG